MGSATAPMTVEQYYRRTVEGDRAQLIGGELVVNDPRPIHALLQIRLASALQAWTDAATGRGLVLLPTDVVLGEQDVYGPDIVWLAEEHLPPDLGARLARIPDLCVEIRSPSTWRCDVGRKKSLYEAHGLPELWLVDYDTVLVFRRSDPSQRSFDVALELSSGERLSSPQLPGFALDLDRLYRT